METNLLFLANFLCITHLIVATPSGILRRDEREVVPPRCNETANMVFSQCGNCSYLTCDLIVSSFLHQPCLPCLVDAISDPGCRCKDGYVWHEGACVAVDDCPKPCNQSNERLIACGYKEQRCQPSCSVPNRSAELDQAEDCSKACDDFICACADGYLRHDITGQCIKVESCFGQTGLQNGTDAKSDNNGTSEDGMSAVQISATDGAIVNVSRGPPGENSKSSEEANSRENSASTSHERNASAETPVRSISSENLTTPASSSESGEIQNGEDSVSTPKNTTVEVSPIPSTLSESIPESRNDTLLSNSVMENQQGNISTIQKMTTPTLANSSQTVSHEKSSTAVPPVSVTLQTANTTTGSGSANTSPTTAHDVRETTRKGSTPAGPVAPETIPSSNSNSVVESSTPTPDNGPTSGHTGLIFYWRNDVSRQ